MEIPNSIKICGVTYEVVQHQNPADVQGFDGRTNFSWKTITLDSRLRQDYKEQVFLHELLHACYDAVGLNEFKEITEEQFVSSIAPVLYATLKENNLNFTE